MHSGPVTNSYYAMLRLKLPQGSTRQGLTVSIELRLDHLQGTVFAVIL